MNNYETDEDIIVVFDNYLLSSTKDSTYIRRNRGRIGRKLVPSLHNLFAVKNVTFFKASISLNACDQIVRFWYQLNAFRWRCRLGYCVQCRILILSHYNLSFLQPVHLHSDSSKTAIYIKKSKQLLADELAQSTAAIHAVCGCDNPSRLHSVASHALLQNVLKKVFPLLSSDRKVIQQAGEKSVLLLLGGKRQKILDELRVQK